MVLRLSSNAFIRKRWISDVGLTLKVQGNGGAKGRYQWSYKELLELRIYG